MLVKHERHVVNDRFASGSRQFRSPVAGQRPTIKSAAINEITMDVSIDRLHSLWTVTAIGGIVWPHVPSLHLSAWSDHSWSSIPVRDRDQDNGARKKQARRGELWP